MEYKTLIEPKFNHINKYKFEELKTIELGGMRRYILPSGDKYPSITSVLGATEDKTWLEDWRNMLGPTKANAESARCAKRGIDLHHLAEQYLSNLELEVDKFAREHVALFYQIRSHLNKIKNIHGLEKALYNNQLRIAGRCDCIADYNGVPSIIDFKTSNRFKIKENIQNYFIQATFYALAFNEMFDECIEDIVILVAVEKDGIPMVFQEKINKFIRPLLQKAKQIRK